MQKITNEQVEDTIQKLYAWAEKRDHVNKQRPKDNSLDNTLIKQAISTIQSLNSERNEKVEFPSRTVKPRL